METGIIETIAEHIGEILVSRGGGKVPSIGHIFYMKQESMAVHEVLHRGVHCIIWRRDIYNGIISIKKRFTKNKWKFTQTGKARSRHPELYSLKYTVVSKRDIPDIEPAISFLFTRSTKSIVEDKYKLKYVLQLLKHTINLKRVMGEENLSQLFKWVDVTYGVRPIPKSHTGSGMSFGYEMAHCKSAKKKFNKKIPLRPK